MVCCYSDTVRRAQCITEPCFRNHQQVCNRYCYKQKIGSLWLLIAAVAASAVAGLVFSSLQSRVSAKIALRVNNDMRAELFDKLMRADWQSVKNFRAATF